jgi:hypothetical protein
MPADISSRMHQMQSRRRRGEVSTRRACSDGQIRWTSAGTCATVPPTQSMYLKRSCRAEPRCRHQAQG